MVIYGAIKYLLTPTRLSSRILEIKSFQRRREEVDEDADSKLL